MCFLAYFVKSSRNPITPIPMNANKARSPSGANTLMLKSRPFPTVKKLKWAKRYPRMVPRIRTTPPIVGVPRLCMCPCTSSWMNWPMLRRRRMRIAIGVTKIVNANAVAAAMRS